MIHVARTACAVLKPTNTADFINNFLLACLSVRELNVVVVGRGGGVGGRGGEGEEFLYGV